MTINKIYIDANQLLLDSYELGLQVIDCDFHPDFIVGVWRGGAPVAIAIHELLDYAGLKTDHIAIRTSLYTGINQTAATVTVEGLDYLVERVKAGDKILIVDDVFDSGRSVEQVIYDLTQKCGANIPELRVATPYYKPANNQTKLTPDFYLHETDEWLVFPHELDGLSADEVLDDKPGLGHIRKRIAGLQRN
jgi:uncharacterized protein